MAQMAVPCAENRSWPCSPVGELVENLDHAWVLLLHLVDDALDDLVALAFLLQVLAGLLLRNLGLELV